jgi:DNA repair protein RadA/Sms
VPFLDARLKEVDKIGFKRAVIPAGTNIGERNQGGLEIVEVKNLDDFVETVMEGSCW